MPLTTCQRCSEPIESPATLCTDCRVAQSNHEDFPVTADAIKNCEVCGTRVMVTSSREGTNYYIPLEAKRIEALELVAECVRRFISPASLSHKYLHSAIAALDRVEGEGK